MPEKLAHGIMETNMANPPLMPKATAVWLVEHTTLTFDQIGEFCGLHKLEVQAIADGEVAIGINGMDPVLNGQLTQDEIKRCENDPRARLKMVKSDLPQPVLRSKGPRYTPVSKRADKPDAVAYLIKTYPELLDAQVARLLGTTKDTIAKVRDRSHWNSANIKPHNPVLVGLCKQSDLDAALKRAQRRVARENKKAGITTPKPEENLAENNNEPIIEMGSQDDQPDIDPETMFRNMG
jgi:hypothetical protein